LAVLLAIIGLATLRMSGVSFVIFIPGLAEFIRQIVTWMQTTMEASSGLFAGSPYTADRLVELTGGKPEIIEGLAW